MITNDNIHRDAFTQENIKESFAPLIQDNIVDKLAAINNVTQMNDVFDAMFLQVRKERIFPKLEEEFVEQETVASCTRMGIIYQRNFHGRALLATRLRNSVVEKLCLR
jgi:CO dehydrogenase/acetyl-CoA synthase beta subunit